MTVVARRIRRLWDMGLFATHSAVVLPYTGDFTAQSGVVFLSLAYELPVVASEVGGLRDLLNEFAVGTTFKDQSVAALVDAIRRLHSASSDSSFLQAIRAAKQRFSWSAAAEETIHAYDQTLSFRQNRLCAREVA